MLVLIDKANKIVDFAKWIYALFLSRLSMLPIICLLITEIATIWTNILHLIWTFRESKRVSIVHHAACSSLTFVATENTIKSCKNLSSQMREIFPPFLSKILLTQTKSVLSSLLLCLRNQEYKKNLKFHITNEKLH